MTGDAELIKAGTQGLVEGTLAPFHELILLLLGPAAEEAGGMLKQSVERFRASRTTRFFSRTSDKIQATGVGPQPVSLKILLPIVESASVEDDDDLQDVWANLLANAATSPYGDGIVPSYPAILKDLTARDVKYLDTLFLAASERYETDRLNQVEHVKFGAEHLLPIYVRAGLSRIPSVKDTDPSQLQNATIQADISAMFLSIDTFLRQGVLEKVFEVPVKEDNRNIYTLGKSYSFTHLGSNFVRACREPRQSC
jgi:hypothetical protein